MADVNCLKTRSNVEEAPAAPDSTTSMFSEGEDVLVDRNHSGQFFMGTIVQIDRSTEKCLLRFLDNKECWAHLSELQRIKDDSAEILCVICKKADKNVIACPQCGRGNHQSCLLPSAPNGVPPSKLWCRRCGNKALKKKRARLSLGRSQSANQEQAVTIAPANKLLHPSLSSSLKNEDHCLSNAFSDVPSTFMPSTSKVLPLPPQVSKTPVITFTYSPHLLSWDESHRVNEENLYCYCALPGDWYMQMLQCAHCRQWFHQDCLSCLHYPLYCGDMLYVFVCSVCNDGEEFLRRLEIGWVDMVHLSIFNLTIFNKKKYFDLDRELLPYIKNNWFYLQIPAQLVKCSDVELRRTILKMLRDNSTRNCRFKSGRALKGQTTIWGLRVRAPPKRPAFTLPPVRPLNDAALQAWWKNCHITYLPFLNPDYFMRSGMVLHQNGNFASFDYGLLVGGAQCDLDLKTTKDLLQAACGLHLLDIHTRFENRPSRVPINGEQVCIKSAENFSGYAKKSSAYPAPNRLTLQESLRRNRRSFRNKTSGRLALKKGLLNGCSGIGTDIQGTVNQDEYDSQDSQASISADEAGNFSNPPSPDEISQDELGQEDDVLSQEEDITSQDEAEMSIEEGITSQDDDGSDDECESSQDDIASYSQDDDSQASHESQDDDDNNQCKSKKHRTRSLSQLKCEAETEHRELVLTPPPSGAPNTPQPSGSPVTEAAVTLPVILATPADTEAEDDSRGPSDSSSLPSVADLLGAPIKMERKSVIPLIPTLPRLTPVITEPLPARPVKRKLSEKDIKIVNGQVKQRRRIRRTHSNHTVGTKTVLLDSGEKLEKRIVGGKLLRSPHKPQVIEPVVDSIAPCEEAGTAAGPQLVSKDIGPTEISLADIKKSVTSYFSAFNRIAAGEKFKIKGKRVTSLGTEYLIEWDYPLL